MSTRPTSSGSTGTRPTSSGSTGTRPTSSGSTGGRAPVIRLGIRVSRERAEIALAALLPVLGAGAEEIELDDGSVEYALYAPRAELPTIGDLREMAGDAVLDVALSEVAPGWERRWHEYLRPHEVGSGDRRIRVRPPWLPADGRPGVLDIVIDPAEVFGAGGHPTTQLCLELLLDAEPEGPLCDWGAGSGVVAVAAARLGFEPVEAVEVMPDGLEAIKRNAAANGVHVRTRWSNLAATPAPWAPTVTANLTLDLLVTIADEVVERPPEHLLASGVLTERADDVVAAFARHGLRESDRRVRGEWAAVRLDLG
jgi:ribosomal protein L11 methyltransferase